jgi:LysM repeat protein
MDKQELNLNELEDVTGGKGGSPTKLPHVEGLMVYKIVHGDTLTKIAGRFHTTVKYLMSINPTIKNANDITAGFYMYVPEV